MRHKHHIVPKHAGGTNDPSNLIEVTIEQHAELHLSRYLSFGEKEDWWAFMGLSGQMSKEDIFAETCKSWLGKKRSEETKLKMRKPHGPKHTPESRAKISAARKGKTLSPEHKEKISKSLEGNQRSLGKTLSLDHKEKLSKAMEGNQNALKK